MYYVEIKCQLDATDDIYCRFYCLLNMFRAPLCPSSGAREYCTDGRCLWYLVFKLSVWCGAEGYVSVLQAAAAVVAGSVVAAVAGHLTKGPFPLDGLR